MTKEEIQERTKKSQYSLFCIVSHVTVEPIAFLHSVSYAISLTVGPILYMDKICSVRLFTFAKTGSIKHHEC